MLDVTCYLCEGGIDASDQRQAQHWRGVTLHRACHSAVRCAIRQCKTNPDKDKLLADFSLDPESFKEVVQPLIVSDGGTRSDGARKAFKKKVVTTLTSQFKHTVKNKERCC